MKKIKKKLTKFEKFMFCITFILLVLSPIMSVFAKSELTKVNYEVEETKNEISSLSKTSESLEKKINELLSLENLQKLAEEMGLSYTSSSVKVVE